MISCKNCERKTSTGNKLCREHRQIKKMVNSGKFTANAVEVLEKTLPQICQKYTPKDGKSVSFPQSRIYVYDGVRVHYQRTKQTPKGVGELSGEYCALNGLEDRVLADFPVCLQRILYVKRLFPEERESAKQYLDGLKIYV